MRTIRWDAHSNLPLSRTFRVENLLAHRTAGFDFVSLNIGYDPAPVEDIVAALATYRAQLAADDRFQLVGTIAELDGARAAGRLGVAFDLEGALCLLDEPAMVGLYKDLGVRQMHLAYNRNNAAAGGCYDPDIRLTALGRAFVAALNTAGVIVDCSHGGRLCSLEIMAVSEKPVVFSHANVDALAPSPRNLTDDQIRACAATGGVIGVVAYSRLLGATPSRAEDLVRHIDYIAQLVGPAHVGLGWDYAYGDDDPAARPGDPKRFDWWFPDAAANRASGLTPAQKHTPLPEALRLPDLLAAAGYDPAAIAGVLGGNFRRVAEATWPA